MGIEEIEKPGGVWCQHARPGQGCAIHGQHPTACRVFMCQWLFQADIPEELKPNRSKVILTAVKGARETQLVVYTDPSDPNAWRRGAMHAFLRQQTGGGGIGYARSVMVWVGKRMWLMTPDGDFDLGEINGRKKFRIEKGPDGKPYVRQLEGSDDPRPAS